MTLALVKQHQVAKRKERGYSVEIQCADVEVAGDAQNKVALVLQLMMITSFLFHLAVQEIQHQSSTAFIKVFATRVT
jgi:hypothetical protein